MLSSRDNDVSGSRHAERFANRTERRQMTPMKRRTLLGLLAGLPVVPAIAHAQPRFDPTPQDRADMARITAYLDGLRTMKAHFLQVAPSGAITRGTVWLDRPGRMRFQYNPPS